MIPDTPEFAVPLLQVMVFASAIIIVFLSEPAINRMSPCSPWITRLAFHFLTVGGAGNALYVALGDKPNWPETVIIFIVTGKTTLAKYLEGKGYQRIVTYTTRPMREGEIDGIDYHFITEEEFTKKILTRSFAEYTSREGQNGKCWYGSAKKDYITPGRKVIVLDPYGVMALTEPTYVVWLDIPEEIRLARVVGRGYSISDVSVRYTADKRDFKKFEESLLFDMQITDEMPVEKMADDIIKQVEKYDLRML